MDSAHCHGCREFRASLGSDGQHWCHVRHTCMWNGAMQLNTLAAQSVTNSNQFLFRTSSTSHIGGALPRGPRFMGTLHFGVASCTELVVGFRHGVPQLGVEFRGGDSKFRSLGIGFRCCGVADRSFGGGLRSLGVGCRPFGVGIRSYGMAAEFRS